MIILSCVSSLRKSDQKFSKITYWWYMLKLSDLCFPAQVANQGSPEFHRFGILRNKLDVAFFVLMWRSSIALSYRRLIYIYRFILCICLTDFYSVCTNLLSHQQWIRNLLFPPHQHLLSVILKILAILPRVRMSQFLFFALFLFLFFQYVLAILILSVENSLFRLLAHF